MLYHFYMDMAFYSVKEFAEKLNVSQHTIRRSLKNGRIIGFKVGTGEKSHYRIPHTEFERMALIDLRNVLKRVYPDEL